MPAASSFEFPDNFLICGIKKWTLLWIIAIVKLMFISPKILLIISSLYFIPKGISICKSKLSSTPIFLLDVITVEIIHESLAQVQNTHSNISWAINNLCVLDLMYCHKILSEFLFSYIPWLGYHL